MAEVNTTAPMPQFARLRWRWGPADTVIALATGLLVLVFAIFTALCWQGYNTTLQTARDKAETAATQIAGDSAWLIGASRALLQQIAGLAEIPADLTPEQKQKVMRAIGSLPVQGTLGLYDATGAAFAEGENPLLGPSIADSDLFKTLEAGGDWTISTQLQEPTTGKGFFVVAQRLGTAEFGGVALLSLPNEAMEKFWGPLKLGTESTVSLIRADGWLVARYPALPQTLQLSAAPPFTTMANDVNGTYESARSPADGIARVVGFRRMPEQGIVAIASVSQDQVLAGLWSAIITVLWLLGPISLALLVGSVITSRILRQSTRTQASLAAALEHNDVLFREIHHRVKNNLQSVSSLLQMQPIPRDVKQNMAQRISAMSAVHEHIYRSDNFSVVRVRDYLLNLIESIHAGSGPQVQLGAEIADLAIDKDAATPLGLILNEVVSNAFKHAFADGREGRVDVLLRQDETGWAELTVRDNGLGFDPELPATGIGRRLIAGLTGQLKGESRFSSSPGHGSEFMLRFPVQAI